jgi:hypothetical protein
VYVERLPSGQWGLYRENGQRLSVHRTRKDADRARILVLQRSRRRRQLRKSNG